MDYNLSKKQASIRAEFEAMLQYVTSEEAQTATADQVEKSLFELVLRLGFQLLQLFFPGSSGFCGTDAVKARSSLRYQKK